MARSLKPKENENVLLAAVKFAMLAQPDKEADSERETHCLITGGRIVATNGILTASSPIPIMVNHCPQTARLYAALSRAKGAAQISATDDRSLIISAGKLRVAVPCIDPRLISITHPNPVSGPLNRSFVDAMLAAGIYTRDGADEVLCASICIHDGMAWGTNRHCMVQAWHGFALPTIMLPRTFALALKSVDKEITNVGADTSSITVYFDDGSWLKSQTYVEKWPIESAKRIMGEADGKTYIDLSDELYEAIAAVEPHSSDETKKFFFRENKIKSHVAPGQGAEYDFPHIWGIVGFNAAYVKTLKGVATKYTVDAQARKLFFAGNAVRGMILGLDTK